MNSTKLFLSFIVLSALAGCGGSGGPTLTDAEFNAKAVEFVANKSKELNVELTMVKSPSDQRNFVVVYNPQSGKYQVYNVVNDNNAVVGIDYVHGQSGFVGVPQGTEVFKNDDKYLTSAFSMETVFDPFLKTYITTPHVYTS